MNVKDAFGIINKRYPNLVAIKIVDYKDEFVFVLKEKGKEDDLRISGNFAVNKNTGSLRAFLPLKENPKEYFKAVKENEIPVNALNSNSKFKKTYFNK